MRHLSSSERPHYVSDRLSAVSDVPMQFLVSAGVLVMILTAASFADFAEKREAAGFVDAQHTASIFSAADRNVTVASVDPCQRRLHPDTVMLLLITELSHGGEAAALAEP